MAWTLLAWTSMPWTLLAWTLATPSMLWMTLAALPVIAFYILRTRPRRHVVSTLLMWDQVFDDQRQRSWWQNLRHLLSLLLQLILIAMLTLALTDPIRSGRRQTTETVLVIDHSASMNAPLDGAQKEGPTRLDEAKRRATEMARSLRAGDSMAVVTAGSMVNVAAGLGDFGPAVVEAIEGIEPSDAPADVAAAVATAGRLTIDPTRRQIVVLSDSFESDSDNKNLQPQVIRIGESTDNVAITGMAVRRSLDDPIGYACWIKVQSFATEPTETRLTLSIGDDLVDVYPIELESDGVWQTTVNGVSQMGGVVRASLDIDDALTADNIARAILPARPPVPIRLVTRPGQEDSPAAFFVRSVFDSIPSMRWVESESDQAAITVYVGATPDVPADNPAEDAVDKPPPSVSSLSASLSSDSLPKGPMLLIAPEQDGPLGTWTLGPPVERPIVVDQASRSPLLRHVRLTNVPLDESRHVQIDDTLGPVTELIEATESTTVAAAVDRPGGRMLILSTQLAAGDLPLRIAFPVMMTNAVNWFLRRGGDLQTTLRSGRADVVDWNGEGELTMRFWSGDEPLDEADLENLPRVTIERNQVRVPAIDRVGLAILAERREPSGAGVARVEMGGSRRSADTTVTAGETVATRMLAVNLCDAAESDLRIPETRSETLAADVASSSRPAWWIIISVATGLVVTEWSLFQRRVVA